MAALRIWGRLEARARGAVWIGSQGTVLQQNLADCGPAALASLMLLRGRVPPPLQRLRLEAGTNARGTRALDLVRTAASHGLDLRIQRRSPGQLDPTRPVIAWVRPEHFVVVAALPESDRWLLIDPLTGAWQVGPDRLAELWTGVVLEPTESQPQGHDHRPDPTLLSSISGGVPCRTLASSLAPLPCFSPRRSSRGRP
jgi:ABC-type bacteriocin/lantibiotic exporter with double-glycine peptidase domain